MRSGFSIDIAVGLRDEGLGLGGDPAASLLGFDATLQASFAADTPSQLSLAPRGLPDRPYLRISVPASGAPSVEVDPDAVLDGFLSGSQIQGLRKVLGV
ncbi:hypothetical protein GN330_13670 [Nitratireductor sp. CAU 1489]|uniref:Uncharacterized protein n=1 Tax=Nitratireductor arenosus TaxID=2682096 RepID=A0A844QJW1_9HYPH|nr:hypothetical protein [Nitratireductor arenosus]MVA98293.1 hypothetical protein [Nitratireductor arenosus]